MDRAPMKNLSQNKARPRLLMMVAFANKYNRPACIHALGTDKEVVMNAESLAERQ